MFHVILIYFWLIPEIASGNFQDEIVPTTKIYTRFGDNEIGFVEITILRIVLTEPI